MPAGLWWRSWNYTHQQAVSCLSIFLCANWQTDKVSTYENTLEVDLDKHDGIFLMALLIWQSEWLDVSCYHAPRSVVVYRCFPSTVPVIRFNVALCNSGFWPNTLWLDEGHSKSHYMQRNIAMNFTKHSGYKLTNISWNPFQFTSNIAVAQMWQSKCATAFLVNYYKQLL